MFYGIVEVRVAKPAVYKVRSYIGGKPPGIDWGWEKLQEVAVAAKISPGELLLQYADLGGGLYILEPDDSPNRFRFFEECRFPWRRADLEKRDGGGRRYVDQFAEQDVLVPAGWALAVLEEIEELRRQTPGTYEHFESMRQRGV